MSSDSLEQQKIGMWQNFAVLITPSIQRVVEFAKRIPGFLDLTQDDQLIMIKLGFFEIWLVHISRMVNTTDNTLTFSDGSYITRQQMELMFDVSYVTLTNDLIIYFRFSFPPSSQSFPIKARIYRRSVQLYDHVQ